MRKTDNSINVFFALLKAGLWGESVRLLPFGNIDYNALFELSKEQCVVGLITDGLGRVEDFKVQKKDALPFMQKVVSVEKRNARMDEFIASIVKKMKEDGIRSYVVKGQGIAQCYERPQWRMSGDIDFLFDEKNFSLAVDFFKKLSPQMSGDHHSRHIGLKLEDIDIELHRNQSTGLSFAVDKKLLKIQQQMFDNKDARIWNNNGEEILLPNVDTDVVIVFTHILKHFYKGGIGVRQLCDFCRLLWVYRDSIDCSLLESRLRSMKLLSEWKAFIAFVVEYLGLPKEAAPLYSPSAKWSRKASMIWSFILEVGNFGHNRDMSYHSYPFLIRKFVSFKRRVFDAFRHARIFPLDSLRFLPCIVINGFRAAVVEKK